MWSKQCIFIDLLIQISNNHIPIKYKINSKKKLRCDYTYNYYSNGLFIFRDCADIYSYDKW